MHSTHRVLLVCVCTTADFCTFATSALHSIHPDKPQLCKQLLTGIDSCAYSCTPTAHAKFEVWDSETRMFSINSSRAKAYWSDLQWRMVHQRCFLGLPAGRLMKTWMLIILLCIGQAQLTALWDFMTIPTKNWMFTMKWLATGTNNSIATICKFLHLVLHTRS